MARRLRPEGLEFITTAPVRHVLARDVSAPVKTVYEALAYDVGNWPSWFSSIVYARSIDEGRGRLVRFQGRFWFRESILAADAPTAYAYRIDRTNFPGLRALVEEWRLTPLGTDAGAGTRVQWTFAADAVAPMRFLLRRGQRGLNQTFDTAVANLDRQLRDAAGA
ncbi:SRPBCC family protein [Streptomyces lasiicapitis]|uniref:SRPBCC family protein n=1 Tax=Streptomyces lasiicapitis TaxID=1923961 RepID=UPI0036CD5456